MSNQIFMMPEPENIRLASIPDLFNGNSPIIGAAYYYNTGRELQLRTITPSTNRMEIIKKILTDRIWVVK
jgi:hypothetical protein